MRKNCVSIDLDNKLKIILEHVYSDCTLILCLNSTFLTGLFINHQWWPRMGLTFWSNHQQFVIILVRITWNGLRSGNQQSAMFDLLRTVRNLKKKKNSSATPRKTDPHKSQEVGIHWMHQLCEQHIDPNLNSRKC